MPLTARLAASLIENLASNFDSANAYSHREIITVCMTCMCFRVRRVTWNGDPNLGAERLARHDQVVENDFAFECTLIPSPRDAQFASGAKAYSPFDLRHHSQLDSCFTVSNIAATVEQLTTQTFRSTAQQLNTTKATYKNVPQEVLVSNISSL